MALIKEGTFEIVQEVPARNEDMYFEVDDLIAEPVALLNKKGYYTCDSCAGHPFDSVNEITVPALSPRSVGDVAAPEVTVGKIMKKEIVWTKKRYSYVEFEENYFESVSLPIGWQYDWEGQRLYIRYPAGLPTYEFAQWQLEHLVSLTKWVEGLERKN